jgi:acyl-[acyl-carrier-protein]-phospholipid O-acyltransferase/long-chain-fatty-acid--[acyl-carrier-protein] ligase
VLFGTPTFLRGYIRKCGPEQFKTVRLPILGAEKLKPEVAADIQKGLGILPYEGYGCTETGPVVAVNIPDRITLPDGRVMEGNHPGTVGMPVPGTRIKVTDPDSGAPLPLGTEGMVHVHGPQVMPGYLNQPELTAKVLRDGWYCTGDLGFLDDEGFLHITGRLSRFSKIGGEMVPHEKVESLIAEMISTHSDDELPHVAVTAVPDERRGERLIVVHTDLPLEPAEICRRLVASSMPRLWIPDPEDFMAVDALPVLATGKLDLRHLRDLALSRSRN